LLSAAASDTFLESSEGDNGLAAEASSPICDQRPLESCTAMAQKGQSLCVCDRLTEHRQAPTGLKLGVTRGILSSGISMDPNGSSGDR